MRAVQPRVRRFNGRISILLVLLALLAACGPDSVPSPAPAVGSPPPRATLRPSASALPTIAAAAPTTMPTVPPPIPTATRTPEPTPDPGYAAAMRPPFEGDIAANADLPRYDLKLYIDPATGMLSGTERIALSNT